MARNAKFIQAKSKRHEVLELDATHFKVTSGASGNEYMVYYDGVRSVCQCNWGQTRPRGMRCGCSHVIAVVRHVEAKAIAVWANKEDATRQHKHIIEHGDGILVTVR